MDINHEFWGLVEDDWAGFSAELEFESTEFENPARIFLGDEYDEDGEESPLPSKEQLDDYAEMYKAFIQSFDSIFVEIKEKAFDRYKRLYAHFYESDGPPLFINDPEEHFGYMKNLVYLRISNQGIIRLPIRYVLDEEHGLEIKIQNNKVINIGGIADT